MSSPTSRRNSCRGFVCGSRASSECHVRRRASSCSYFSSGAQPEAFSVRLSQPIFTITLRFLLAIDLWLSKRLGVCACEESPWGSIRPLVRLVEFSGHVIPWLIGTVYTLLRGESVAEQEIMLNLALGERVCVDCFEFGLSGLQWGYRCPRWFGFLQSNYQPWSIDNLFIYLISTCSVSYNVFICEINFPECSSLMWITGIHLIGLLSFRCPLFTHFSIHQLRGKPMRYCAHLCQFQRDALWGQSEGGSSFVEVDHVNGYWNSTAQQSKAASVQPSVK